MIQVFTETIEALSKAETESEMKLIVLAMNARLPRVFHVLIRDHKSPYSIRTIRRFYLSRVHHQITMWDKKAHLT